MKNLCLSEFSCRIEIRIKKMKYFSIALLRSTPLQKWCANVYWSSVYSPITKQIRQKQQGLISFYYSFLVLFSTLVFKPISSMFAENGSCVFGLTVWDDVTVTLNDVLSLVTVTHSVCLSHTPRPFWGPL